MFLIWKKIHSSTFSQSQQTHYYIYGIIIIQYKSFIVINGNTIGKLFTKLILHSTWFGYWRQAKVEKKKEARRVA